jgi:vancomycin permeability regulator SanA
MSLKVCRRLLVGIVSSFSTAILWVGRAIPWDVQSKRWKEAHWYPLRALKEVSTTLEANFLPLPSFSFAFYDKYSDEKYSQR